MPDPPEGQLTHPLPVFLHEVHGDVPQTLLLHEPGAVQASRPPLWILATRQLVLYVAENRRTNINLTLNSLVPQQHPPISNGPIGEWYQIK